LTRWFDRGFGHSPDGVVQLPVRRAPRPLRPRAAGGGGGGGEGGAAAGAEGVGLGEGRAGGTVSE
jgi:hypothetical protein